MALLDSDLFALTGQSTSDSDQGFIVIQVKRHRWCHTDTWPKPSWYTHEVHISWIWVSVRRQFCPAPYVAWKGTAM